MRKSVFVLAVIGAACSSVAFAAEVKNDKAHIPAVKATTMSDNDMDKVTAGFSSNQLNADPQPPGFIKNSGGADISFGGCSRLARTGAGFSGC
jgi:hypothetical protein